MYGALNYITLILYATAVILWLIFLATFNKGIVRAGKIVLIGAVAFHLATIGWHHYHHLPPPIMHPVSIIDMLAFLFALAYLIATAFYDIDILGIFVVPVVTIVLFSTTTRSFIAINQLSYQRFISPVHIASAILAFLGFSISFVCALMYALQDFSIKIKREPISFLPALTTAERLSFKSILISFPIYTFAVILGTIWAASRPGGFLSNPQYIGGIISWWLYALFLYGYLYVGWRGRRAVALVIAAYAGVASLALFYAINMWRGA